MQGTWGPHTSESTPTHWQGKWESHDCGESSGQWEAGNWDHWSNDDTGSHYEEFENVMHWDDSGAREALEIAKERTEARSKGLACSPSVVPCPDLYIQEIDWDSHEDLKLPDYRGSSPHGDRTGQRKRGRRGGGGYKGGKRENTHYDRQDHTDALADRRQDSQPFLRPACYGEVEAQNNALYYGPLNALSLDGGPDTNQRDGWPPSSQDYTGGNRASRWSSQPRTDSNYPRAWQDHARSRWDKTSSPQSRENYDRWPRPSAFPEQSRGWVCGNGLPPHTSRDLMDDPRPNAQGSQWLLQGDATNGQAPSHQAMGQFNRGRGRLNYGPMYGSDKTGRWRPQYAPKHPW